MGTFSDDTVILSVNIDPAIATFTLQNQLNQIQEWTKIWKIRLMKLSLRKQILA
jgi:hypothetical protein